MNCHEFDEIVNCLAGDRIMAANLKTNAQAHAAACPTCRTRLADEQKLTLALRAFAGETAESSASRACEERLMNLFDVEMVKPARRYRRERLAYALGLIAAMVLLVTGFSVWAMRPLKNPLFTPANVFSVTINSSPLTAANPVSNIAAGKHPVRGGSRPASSRPQAARHQDKAPAEIVTDFIPVNYGAPGIESGSQIVRVELPRSTLANFGLPVNMDRADHPIKADVLMSVDGVARAIRFVQ